MKVSYSQKGLVEACIKGERKAMKALYDSYGAYLFGVCRRYMPTEAEAEEMLSDAFMRIFEKLESLEDPQKLKAWMKTLTVRICLDELRKARKIQLSWNEEALEEAVNEYPGVIEQMSAKEIKSRVDKLPTGYRTVFMLHTIEGYSHPEIAKMLKISEGTSKSQLSKARRMLRDTLEKGKNFQTVL